MNYIEQLKDFIEILNHTIKKIDKSDVIEFDGERIFIMDDMYDYIIVSSDEEAGKILPLDDDIAEGFKTIAINTREQFISLCKEIEDRTLDLAIQSANTLYYIYSLERYIENFAKKLKSEWECFKDTPLNSLPIYITGQDAHDENGEYSDNVDGTFSPYSGLITINNAGMENKDLEEQSARHETIHCILARTGLPYQDDSPLFWFFATIYDAHPYADMTEENKVLFETLMNIYKKEKESIQTILVNVKAKLAEQND